MNDEQKELLHQVFVKYCPGKISLNTTQMLQDILLSTFLDDQVKSLVVENLDSLRREAIY